MEHSGLIALLIIFALVALSELREWRSSRKHRVVVAHLGATKRRVESQVDVSEEMRVQISALAHAIGQLSDKIKASLEKEDETREFITKAQVDLATIVNEYKINGIPLGYDRGKSPDFYEGL